MKRNNTKGIAKFLLPACALTAFAVATPVKAETNTAQPLPFHTIEGCGGGAITPTAYLANPTPDSKGAGKPSFAVSYVNLGDKSLTALTLTETFKGRVELGFGADQLQLGSLPTAIQNATTVNINKSNLWMYNWNVRYLAIKEDTKTPAVTIGVHYKNNPGIGQINSSLGGALGTIGYKNTHGFDYTVTASKMFTKGLPKPLIATVGLRESEAAQLGLLGFSDSYKLTAEGSLIYLPADKIVVAYEVRGKSNPYKKIPGVIGDEGVWHAFDISYIVSPNATIVAGYGQFGNVANKSANSTYWIQLKQNL